MPLFNSSRRPKALLIYVSAILMLTVVFLSIGIGSIAREWKVLQSLSNGQSVGQASSTGQDPVQAAAAKLQRSKCDLAYLAFANLLFLAVMTVGAIQVARIAREHAAR